MLNALAPHRVGWKQPGLFWPPGVVSSAQPCSWRTKCTQTDSQCALREQLQDTSRFWGMSFLLRTLKKSTLCFAIFSSSTVLWPQVRFSILRTLIYNKSAMASPHSPLINGYGLLVIFLHEWGTHILIYSNVHVVVNIRWYTHVCEDLQLWMVEAQPVGWLRWWYIISETS